MKTTPRFYISNNLKELLKEIIFLPFSKSKNNIKSLQKLLNSKYIIITNYGRSAFFHILRYLKSIDNRQEVLISSYNFYEVINSIVYAGLKPIFFDLKKNSLDSNYKDILAKINKKTLAIVITHLNGKNGTLNKIKKICNKKKIILIEDCAVALNYKKKEVGKSADFSFYSLNMTKNLNGVTGGIIKCKNKKNFKKLSKNMKITKFSNLNYKNYFLMFCIKILISESIYKHFFRLIRKLRENKITFLSYLYKLNYKPKIENKIPFYYLNNHPKINSRILNSNYSKFFRETDKRIENNKYYYKKLNKIKNILALIEKKNLDHLTMEFPILLKNKNKKIYSYLLENNFDLREIYYKNCNNLKIYNKFKNKNIQYAKSIEDRILCFPNHPEINHNYINELTKKIKSFFKND